MDQFEDLQSTSAKIVGATANVTGAGGGDCVVLFTGVTAREAIDDRLLALTRLDDANLGTTLKIAERGVFDVQAELPCGGANAYEAGVSVDEGATLSTDPTILVAGVRGTDRFTGAAAGDIGQLNPSCRVYITQAMANNAAQGIVRVRISNAADAAPTAAGIVVAQVAVMIRKIADLPGS